MLNCHKGEKKKYKEFNPEIAGVISLPNYEILIPFPLFKLKRIKHILPTAL
jgi:hypothetical protein